MLNSANKNLAILRALANIRVADEVAVIEVSVPAADRATTRAGWVKPDICVITDVGFEHMRSHGGSLDNVIANKARVAVGLKTRGIFVIPEKDGVTEKLRHEILSHGDFSFRVFGYGRECDAYIIKEEFDGFSWDITANIEGMTVAYNLPLLEEYAPKASLAVLLTAFYVGADLHKAVRDYASYQQYSSSGNFYEFVHPRGRFYL